MFLLDHKCLSFLWRDVTEMILFFFSASGQNQEEKEGWDTER